MQINDDATWPKHRPYNFKSAAGNAPLPSSPRVDVRERFGPCRPATAALGGSSLDIVRRNHLHLPANLALLLKTVAMSESLGLRLDPEFRLASVLEPYAEGLMLKRFSPALWAPRLERAGADAARLGTELPGQLRRLLGEIERGRPRGRDAARGLRAAGAPVRATRQPDRAGYPRGRLRQRAGGADVRLSPSGLAVVGWLRLRRRRPAGGGARRLPRLDDVEVALRFMQESLFFGGSLIAALIAGVIALFALCCISVMLPSYFATSFQNRGRLVAMTFLFAAGVATVILPIALGAAILLRVINAGHTPLYVVGGGLMLALGVYTLLGGKLNLPSPSGRPSSSAGPVAVYSLGLFSLDRCDLSGSGLACDAPGRCRQTPLGRPDL